MVLPALTAPNARATAPTRLPPRRPVAAPCRPVAAPRRPVAAPRRPVAAPCRPVAAPRRPVAAAAQPVRQVQERHVLLDHKNATRPPAAPDRCQSTSRARALTPLTTTALEHSALKSGNGIPPAASLLIVARWDRNSSTRGCGRRARKWPFSSSGLRPQSVATVIQ